MGESRTRSTIINAVHVFGVHVVIFWIIEVYIRYVAKERGLFVLSVRATSDFEASTKC